MGTEWRALRSALAFLTILPSNDTDLAGADYARAGRWFALVGALVGALLVAVAWLAGRLWPSEVAGAVIVAVWVVLTGALHLDGALDSFDAVAVEAPPERRLEILKDVHTGAFAVIAGVLLLLIKWATVVALLQPGRSVATLLLPPVVGRAAMVWAQYRWPYGRTAGLGTLVSPAPGSLLLNGLVVLAIAALAGYHGLLAAALGLLAAHLFGAWVAARLGGCLTGDGYGAICEAVEVVTLLVLTVELL